MIRTYRPRPWAVEAIQYTAETCREISEWVGELWEGHAPGVCGEVEITVPMAGGWQDIYPGDWVVKIHDEFRVMDTDTFAATYEEAT